MGRAKYITKKFKADYTWRMLFTIQLRILSHFLYTVNIKRYKTILYKYGTWSLTLKEEHILNISEKKMLRIFLERTE
jgi:hypothetical protein